jgi:hypothetical protein
MTFTDNELELLKSFYYSALVNGHDFGYTYEHILDPRKARGVISSLIKKNVICVHEPVRTEIGYCQQFTWKGKAAEVIKEGYSCRDTEEKTEELFAKMIEACGSE